MIDSSLSPQAHLAQQRGTGRLLRCVFLALFWIGSTAWAGGWPPAAGGGPATGGGTPPSTQQRLEDDYGHPLTAYNLEEIASWRLGDLDWWRSAERNRESFEKRRRLLMLRSNTGQTLRSVREYEELFGLQVTAPGSQELPSGVEGSEGWVVISGRLRPDMFALSELITTFIDGLFFPHFKDLRDPMDDVDLALLAERVAEDPAVLRRMVWLWRMLDLGLLPPALDEGGPGSGAAATSGVDAAARRFVEAALATLYPQLKVGLLASQRQAVDRWWGVLEELRSAPQSDIREAWQPLEEAAAREDFESREARCNAFLEELPPRHRYYFLRFVTGTFVRAFEVLEEIEARERAAAFFHRLDIDTRGAAYADYTRGPSTPSGTIRFQPWKTGLEIEKQGEIIVTGNGIQKGKLLVYTLGDRLSVTYGMTIDSNLTSSFYPYQADGQGQANLDYTPSGGGAASVIQGTEFGGFCEIWQSPLRKCVISNSNAFFYRQEPGLYGGTSSTGPAATNTRFNVNTIDVQLQSVITHYLELGLTIKDVGGKIELSTEDGVVFSFPKHQRQYDIFQTSRSSVRLCGPEDTDPTCCRLPMRADENGGCMCPEGQVPNPEGGHPPCVDVCEVRPTLCDGPDEEPVVLIETVPEDWDQPIEDPGTPGETPCVTTSFIIWITVEIPIFGTVNVPITVEACSPPSDYNKRLDCSDGRWWYICDPRVRHVDMPSPVFRCTPGERRCLGDLDQGTQACGGDGFWQWPTLCPHGCDGGTGSCGNGAACAEGDTRCTPDGGSIQVCAGGLWGTALPCIGGCSSATQLCSGDAGGSACYGNNARRCVADGGALQRCENGSWGAIEVCENGCDPAVLACRDLGDPVCTSGELRCVDGNTRSQHCGDGVWGPAQLCAYGCDTATGACHVSDPACPADAPNRCDVLGRLLCSGDTLVRCTLASNGCLTWQPQEVCANGCAANACIGATCSGIDVCHVEDAARCLTTTARELCLPAADGCLRWQTPAVGGTCDGSGHEVCQQGSCLAVPCQSHADCAASSSSCQAGYCAPCADGSDCRSGYRCLASGRCAPLI